MIIEGFALERISTEEEIEWWESIPPTVRIPEALITVDAASAGWSFDDYRIIERSKEFPDPPVVVPSVITDRQFGHALFLAGIITHEERMAFVKTGEIPSSLAAVVAAIPDQGTREDAEYMISGAQTFERHHPMVELLRQAMGWSVEQTDGLWVTGASL